MPSSRIVEVLNYYEARIRREEFSQRKSSLYPIWILMKSWWEKADKDFLKEITLTLISKL